MSGTAKAKAVYRQRELQSKHKGPSILLPPQTRKSGALGDPGSRAGLPIHAKIGREWGPDKHALA